MSDVMRPLGAQRTRVEVRTYPRDDTAFHQLVVSRLRRFDRVRRLAAIPARLEQLLQPDAPHARSRYQDPLASDSGMPVLYVFRDGALVTPAGTEADDDAERASHDPGAAA